MNRLFRVGLKLTPMCVATPCSINLLDDKTSTVGRQSGRAWFTRDIKYGTTGYQKAYIKQKETRTVGKGIFERLALIMVYNLGI